MENLREPTVWITKWKWTMMPFKAFDFTRRWFRLLRGFRAFQARPSVGKADGSAHPDANRLIRFLAPVCSNMFLHAPGDAARRAKTVPPQLLAGHPSHLGSEPLQEAQYRGGSAIAAQGLPESSRNKPVK